LGIEFSIKTIEVDETYPEGIEREQIPQFLSEKKAEPFRESLLENDLIITADTIVWKDGKVLGKPKNREEATATLKVANQQIHKFVSKGILKKETAARKISRLHRAVNAI